MYLMPSMLEDCKITPKKQFQIIINMQNWTNDRMFNVTGITNEQLDKAIKDHKLLQNEDFLKLKKKF